jgi:hypothetical protein
MNTNIDHAQFDDVPIDRLVDDELTEKDRLVLLARLDREPGGWRRCALAFLESQCWKRSLREVQPGNNATAQSANLQNGVSVCPAQRAWWNNRIATALAMAACFLLTFWVGSLVRTNRFAGQPTPAGSSPQIAASERPAPNPVSQPDRALAGAWPWRMVTVSSHAGADARGGSFTLPAVERDSVDQQWLQSLPSAVPDDLLEALSRSGNRVEQHRELIPMPLEDGRQLVVPVDHVDVHYTGNPTY